MNDPWAKRDPHRALDAEADAGASAAGEPSDDPWGDDATAVVASTDIGGFFGERFRLDARLGVGAMGRVLTAFDMQSGSIVALKMLHKDRASDPGVIERFRREAEILRAIEHPAIVRLVAFDRSADGTWWLAMEHLVGETLKDRLAQGRPFEPREAWPILASVLDAVSLAHARGILHRDLKPENVLLLQSGLPPAKVLDFGLSRYTAKAERITAKGMVLGTPRYMAPEMLTDSASVDERVDVFAVGTIVFEMLTGRSIYPAEDVGQLFGCILEGRTIPLRAIRPNASPLLEQVIADAVARDPAARIPSIEALSERLARALGVSPDRSAFLPRVASGGAAPRAQDLAQTRLVPPPAGGSRPSQRPTAFVPNAARAGDPAGPLPPPSPSLPGSPSLPSPGLPSPSLSGSPSLPGPPAFARASTPEGGAAGRMSAPSSPSGAGSGQAERWLRSTPSYLERPSLSANFTQPVRSMPPAPPPTSRPWLRVVALALVVLCTLVLAGATGYALRVYLH